MKATSSLLLWEDEGEFAAFSAAVHAEHRPEGPTEAALVDQITSLLWRLRRVATVESRVWRDELMAQTTEALRRVIYCALPEIAGYVIRSSAAALGSDEQTCEAEIDHARRAAAAARAALADFGDREGAIDEALALVDEEDRLHWAEHAKEIDARPDDKEVFARFLARRADGWDGSARLIERRAEMRAQAVAVTFNAARLEPITRYETSLHQSLQQALGMLAGLQARRSAAARARPAMQAAATATP